MTRETRPSLTSALSRISWQTAAVLIAVIAAIVIVWVTSPDHRGDILAALGTIGALLLAVMRPMLRGPALALLVVLGASGCGASALRTHATIATVASVAIAAAAPSVPAACDAALTTCRGEVACVTETAERCRVAARATDGLVAAVRCYVDAVEVASYADEGSVLPALLAAWDGLVRLWPTVVAVLAAIGVTVPALPAVTP